MEYILTLDVGTTSVKTCLFDRELNLAASASREYALFTDGCLAEAEPERYLQAISACVRSLPGRENVRAAAVTTQGETLIPVDRAGRPLSRAIVWLDSRAERAAAELGAKLEPETFYRETGLPGLSGALPLCKLRQIREERPELYEKTDKFLLLEDFILRWLTGRTVTEKSLLTSTGYFSLQKDDYWDEALRLAGVDRDKLPEALECGEPVGRLLPERAEELGLPADALAVTGAMDQTAGALAAGCTGPGVVSETTGTAMVAAAYTDKPVFCAEHHLTIYRHAQKGAYLYLPISNTAGMALKWFRDTLCPDLGDGPESYEALDRLAEGSPPGANGLLFLPYLAGSVDPQNEPGAEACFFGARLSTARGDFVRAVLESVGFQLADFLSMLASLGCRAESIVSLGGGSRSPVWLQIKSDLCNLPVYTLPTSEATSLGAAMLAAKALCRQTGNVPRTLACRPKEDSRPAYEAAGRRWHELFAAVRPLF
jgi:sugar (pentulose or hexulose) kinase